LALPFFFLFFLGPILIDTGMKATQMRWNHDGSVLAIAGVAKATATAGEREGNTVQFYNPYGVVR
jgi:WD repeat-containing protein 35